MTEIKGLVERLRDQCVSFQHSTAELCNEAATAIESLAADKERLTELIGLHEQNIALLNRIIVDERARAALAEKSAEEMRAALKELVRLRGERDELDNTPCVEWTREHSNQLARSNQAFHEAWINARSLLSHPTERP